ncbi:hypothetical protein HHL11_22110 [Ramlibacter sp. G-1-2-2]|uniref:NarX-like N-terminal domain-containing protein n=2 Tax=Ramlibacter agri TaxID=2728837 RepID=A0A848H671_9BURK|nr:type IV pili methyl-accepting chemotaxis transducer N-terminal domain-containing protein [Ramlibacter agri]NML46456.1 hypothetical protein [Ramlibacter agri]
MRRRTLLAAAMASAGTAWAQVTDLADAINKAGRQRMLSQRTCKAYLALVQGVEPEQAQRVLDASVALFERQLGELRAYASTAELRATYGALGSAWGDYKGLLAAPARTGVAAVVAQSGKVLAVAHQGTGQFEALLNQPLGKLVNVAGRQRMLSQRMAAFYLASLMPGDAAAARAEVAKARTDFLAGLDFLRKAPEATPRIKDELQLADLQWVLFDNALQKAAPGDGTKPQSDVFITSENVLQVMDRITTLYTGLKA